MRFATVACALFAVNALTLVSDDARATEVRSTIKVNVTVDGLPLPQLFGADGGYAVTDTVGDSQSPITPKKRPGATRMQPLVLDVGDNRPTNEWITEFLKTDTGPVSRTIAEGFLDADFKHIGTNNFPARLVTVEFSALDLSSKDPIATRLTLQPEAKVTRSASSIPGSMYLPAPAMLASNFRVTVGSLPCSQVVSVAPLTVQAGQYSPTVGNLSLTIATADQKAWEDWRDAALKEKPENSDLQEKSGSIEYLSADKRTVLGKLTFTGLGIVRVSPGKRTMAGRAEPFSAEMYVETVRFSR